MTMSYAQSEYKAVEPSVSNGWLFDSDPAGDWRWALRLDHIVSWHYDVARGVIRLRTVTGHAVDITSGDLDDKFEPVNTVDDLLYEHLIRPPTTGREENHDHRSQQ